MTCYTQQHLTEQNQICSHPRRTPPTELRRQLLKSRLPCVAFPSVDADLGSIDKLIMLCNIKPPLPTCRTVGVDHTPTAEAGLRHG